MKRLLAALLLCAPLSAAWPRAGGGGGGGCFAAGTLVATTAGDIPIEEVEKDNVVLAYSEGRIMQVPVRRAYKEKSRRLTLYTSAGSVTTTAEHPFLTRNGFVEAGDLKVGDDIGRLAEGRLVWVRVTRTRTRGSVDVYNLEVAPPHTFIANGFVVHNKGGGGGGGGRGGRGSAKGNLFMLLIMGPIVLFMKIKELLFGEGGRPPEKVLPRVQVDQRAVETTAILRSLADSEPGLSPKLLETEVRSIFIAMQDAWSRRDYSPLRERIAPALYADHSSQLDAMLARGEKNVMDNVQVKSIDFVHVRYTPEPAQRSVTALITASACDYTVDDNSGAVVGGSRLPRSFQEFWTFRKLNDRWVPAKIHQTSEEYILAAPNLPAVPAGPGFKPAAGEAAPRRIVEAAAALALPAAAALPAASLPPAAAAKAPAPLPPEAAKSSRFDRPDDPWDRQRMEIAATLTFLNVYGAWEKGHAGDIHPDGIVLETLAKLKLMIGERAAEGYKFGFGDLYTKKAEIVLTSPAARNTSRMDEFIARINASARRSLTRDGKTLHRDEGPEPFTEYWVFARGKDARWRFREILPRVRQEGGDGCQADVAPTPVQLEWYWR